MIKAIIFDCFGVIYPQAGEEFYKKHKAALKNNRIVDELNINIDLGRINRSQFFKGLEEATGVPADRIQSMNDKELIPDSNLISFIKQLKENYKVGLLSNAGKEEIEVIYRDKIDHLFDEIVVSYDTGAVKPSTKIFEICVKRLGVKHTECVFIDDSFKNVEAARKLNMKAIQYGKFGKIPDKLKNLIEK